MTTDIIVTPVKNGFTIERRFTDGKNNPHRREFYVAKNRKELVKVMNDILDIKAEEA